MDIPETVSGILGRPARWLSPDSYAAGFDGSERALEVFDVEADEQLGLLQLLRPHRKELEAIAGGPLVFIFHTKARSR